MNGAKKKLLSVVLSIALLGALALPAGGASEEVPDAPSLAHRTFFTGVNELVMQLLRGINRITPEPAWAKAEDYQNESFLPGTAEFLAAPAAGAGWSLGYGKRSLMTGDELDGKHYVAGSIALSAKTATEVLDDLYVRAVALSDGSGRGLTVIAALDAYGLPGSEVNEIRRRMRDYIAAQNIVSLNITTLHQHSAVDTVGMNGDIFQAVLHNPLTNLLKLNRPLVNGKNEAYMAHLYQAVEAAIRQAVEGMEPGKLFYGTADAANFIHDKRAPYVNDPNLNRLRFVPADSSARETWIATSQIHCVGNGAAGRELTGDYPAFMEAQIGERANFMLVMAAQQSNTLERSEISMPEVDWPSLSRYEQLQVYGRALGDKLIAIENDREVAPLLNIRHRELLVPVTNQIIIFAAKNGLFTNAVLKQGRGYATPSELGYLELGEDLAFALIPGELAPELAYGGTLGTGKAWRNEDWPHPSFQESLAATGSARKLHVMGLMNDQIGYIIPDNNFIPIVSPESQNEELVSCGAGVASLLAKEWKALVNS